MTYEGMKSGEKAHLHVDVVGFHPSFLMSSDNERRVIDSLPKQCKYSLQSRQTPDQKQKEPIVDKQSTAADIDQQKKAETQEKSQSDVVRAWVKKFRDDFPALDMVQLKYITEALTWFVKKVSSLGIQIPPVPPGRISDEDEQKLKNFMKWYEGFFGVTPAIPDEKQKIPARGSPAAKVVASVPLNTLGISVSRKVLTICRGGYPTNATCTPWCLKLTEQSGLPDMTLPVNPDADWDCRMKDRKYTLQIVEFPDTEEKEKCPCCGRERLDFRMGVLGMKTDSWCRDCNCQWESKNRKAK